MAAQEFQQFDFRQFDALGYVVLPARTGAVSALVALLEQQFERTGENAGHRLRDVPFGRRLDLPLSAHEPFAALTSDEAVLPFVDHCLGGDFALASLHASSLNPFALPWGEPAPPGFPGELRVVWLLDGFLDAEACALRIVPGSHLRAPGEAPQVLGLQGDAGSAVVLHPALWSAPGWNAGGRHLRLLSCAYARRG